MVLAAIAALGVPVSAVLVRIVDAWTRGSEKRSDDRARQAADYEQRRAAEVAEAYRRIAELREENRALEADRDRGWDVARAWNNKAHEVNHRLNNVLLMIPESSRPEPCALPTFQGIARVGEEKER